MVSSVASRFVSWSLDLSISLQPQYYNFKSQICARNYNYVLFVLVVKIWYQLWHAQGKHYNILLCKMAEQFNEEEEMIINQEYKIWKKEAPYYYDFLLLHSVDWPTFTFQWLPEFEVHDDYTSYFAIIASSSSQVDQCHLQKIRIDHPNEGKSESYFDNKEHKITVVEKIQHNGEILRARYCQADSKLTAIATNKGDITLTSMKEPVGKLVGHTSQGYGLSWNGINKNLLVSGFSDKRICIWDIEKNKQLNQKIFPIFQILHHNAPIQDVAWHKFHPNIFASCSDDRLINIWDVRFRSSSANEDKKPLFEVVAHTDEVYSLDFSPFNEFLFASGSADQNVSVWDMRNLTRSLMTFNGEKNSVIKVQWSPFNSCVLASCGYGRNVDVWDISKEKKEHDTNYLFRHMGHRSKVIDLDWNPHQKLLIASVEENNCIEVWQLARHIYYEDQQAK